MNEFEPISCISDRNMVIRKVSGTFLSRTKFITENEKQAR